MKFYGELATKLRQGIVEKAIDLSEKLASENVEKKENGENVAEILRLRYNKPVKQVKLSIGLEGFEQGINISRKEYRKLSQLQICEQLKIIRMLISKHHTHQEICDQLKIQMSAVKTLNKDLKNNLVALKCRMMKQK